MKYYVYTGFLTMDLSFLPNIEQIIMLVLRFQVNERYYLFKELILISNHPLVTMQAVTNYNNALMFV